MNMHQIVATVAGFFSHGKVPIPASEGAVKSAKKNLALSLLNRFPRSGRNWRGKKSNKRRNAAKKAHIRRRNSA